MREHAAKEGRTFAQRDMGKDRPDDGQVAHKSNEGAYQTYLRTLANPYPIQQAKKHQHADGDFQNKWTDRRAHDAEILNRRQTTDGCCQEVAHQNEHASQRTYPGIHGLRGHRYHPAPFWETRNHLGIFESEQDKHRHGEQDKKTGEIADFSIENPWNIVNRRTDVGKNDGPAKQWAELSAVLHVFFRLV